MIQVNRKFLALLFFGFGLFLLNGCGHTSSLNNAKHFNQYSSNKKGAIYLRNGEIWDARNIRKVEEKMFWTDADTLITHNCNVDELDKIVFNDRTRGILYGALGGGTAILGTAFLRSGLTTFGIKGERESLNQASSNIYSIGIVPAVIVATISGGVIFGLTGIPETFINEE